VADQNHEPTLGYKCSRPKPRATNPSRRGTMAEKPQVSRGKEHSSLNTAQGEPAGRPELQFLARIAWHRKPRFITKNLPRP